MKWSLQFPFHKMYTQTQFRWENLEIRNCIFDFMKYDNVHGLLFHLQLRELEHILSERFFSKMHFSCLRENTTKIRKKRITTERRIQIWDCIDGHRFVSQVLLLTGEFRQPLELFIGFVMGQFWCNRCTGKMLFCQSIVLWTVSSSARFNISFYIMWMCISIVCTWLNNNCYSTIIK